MLIILTLITTKILGSTDYTVVDFEVKKIFDGKFGSRIKTELTVLRNGHQVHVLIQNRLQDRFQRGR